MDIAIPLPSPRHWLSAGTLARPIGIVAGLLLPLIAAACFATYYVRLTPDWLENVRQYGFVYLAGELALIVYARHDGLDLAALFRGLPRWARVALTLFLATFWISSVFVSLNPIFSTVLSLGWIVQLLFAASLYHIVLRRPTANMAEIWPGFVLGLAAIATIIAVHFTVVPAGLIGHEREVDWCAAIPGFVSCRLFGSWSAAILALLTGVAWLVPDGRRVPHALFAAIGIAFALAFWTTTRAAFLGWACVLPVAWLLAGKPASRAFWKWVPLYLLFGAIVTLPLQPYGHPAFTFFEAANSGSPDAFSSGRLTLWRNALQVAKDYPLFGSGAGSSFWLVSLFGFHHVQPHNALVQFLLNWGIIPTLPALALLAGATYYAHVAARICRSILPFVLMLDCLLVMSMLDGMLHFAQFVMLIMGCFAICLAKLPRREKPRALP